MVRQSYANEYLLKNTFDQADAQALKIDIRTPEDLCNEVRLNFGTITFMPKYPKQIKLKKKKNR